MTDPIQSQGKKPHTFFWLLGVLFLAAAAVFAVFVYQAAKNPSTDPLDSLSSTNQVTSDVNASGNAITSQVVTSDDPYFGSPQAKVQIVEFGDFQCPFCAEAVSVVKSLQARYGDRIFFQFRDFPIVSVHDQAYNAAIAASCASEQGNAQFWAYHDRLYQFQNDLADNLYVGLAERTGLDVTKFKPCFDEKATAVEVEQDYQDGIRAGVRGTPTFFINGKRVAGVIPESIFTDVIDRLLKQE